MSQGGRRCVFVLHVGPVVDDVCKNCGAEGGWA